MREAHSWLFFLFLLCKEGIEERRQKKEMRNKKRYDMRVFFLRIDYCFLYPFFYPFFDFLLNFIKGIQKKETRNKKRYDIRFALSWLLFVSFFWFESLIKFYKRDTKKETRLRETLFQSTKYSRLPRTPYFFRV